MTDTIEVATCVSLSPITPRFGAVVEGLNAREPLSPDVVASLKEAILQYKVLFLREQHLTPTEQFALAANFGEPYEGRAGRFSRDYEEGGLSTVTVVPHFHADIMYGKEGPSFSMLQMLELPDLGGNTMWADLVSSYETLSEPVKTMLESLEASYVMPNFYLSDDDLAASHKRQYGEDLEPEKLRALRDFMRPNTHPVVRVIPETGKKNYWVSEQHTERIVGVSKWESEAILGLLFRHQLRPEFVIRWSWSVGDIAFWDHRTTLHSGVFDYDRSQKRRGQRASVGPNEPLGVGSFL